MIINTNMASLNTIRQLGINQKATSNSLAKLSSGLKINGAADDAAGLAISEKMRGQISGLNQASANAQSGINLASTAEGALNETTSILQRMRELAVQGGNGTNTADDNAAMSDEFNQLKSEIDRIGNTTQFNTKNLLDGSLAGASGMAAGQNNTTSSVVAKLTAGTNAAAAAIAPADITNTMLATEETLKIDGTDVKVNWASLSADDKSFLKSADTTDMAVANKAAGIIVNAINSAIDNSGTNVAHISGFSDASGNITLQSGTKGVDSKVDMSATTGGVLEQIFTTAGASTETDGATTYNGTTTSASAADLNVNGVLMSVDLSAVATNSSDMSSVATSLTTAINASIDAYNTSTGKLAGEDGYIKDVSVTATKDGRLSISSDSGPVTLKDRYGATDVADLGLSQAQTQAAGNGGMTFQIGANAGQSLNFGINDMRTAALGLSGVNVDSQTSASSAITAIDAATSKVSAERSKLGAIQNRLEHTINNLGTSSQNITSAEANIRDVDMASEMTNFQKNNILQQAAQAMLAQANQQPQGVLQLLR